MGPTTGSGESTDSTTADDKVVMMSFAIQLLGILLSLLAGELLHQLRWTRYLPESGATILIGLVLGSIMYVTAPSALIQVSHFSESLFTLALLPIVIYESGYSLYRDPLFALFLPISLYAIVGTTVSAAVTSGVIMLAVTSPSAPSYGLPALSTWESITLGCLLSATDPVATLTVFSSLRVEPVLNALVYGESVLNDAVGIVLFRAAAAFITVPPTSDSIAAVVWNTAVVLVGAVVWGVGVGLVCTRALSDANVKGLLGSGGRSAIANAVARLFLRGGRSTRRLSTVKATGAVVVVGGTPGGVGEGEAESEGAAAAAALKGVDTFLSHVMLGTSETSLLLVFGYASFASAEALGLSGIIAALFTGITQAVYARPIMSWPGKKVSTAVLRLLAGLADTAIFLQIGLGLALLGRPGGGEMVLAAVALVGCLLGRAANVYPLSAAINAWAGKPLVPQGTQVQMWWAGLRGGIAFASAVVFPSAAHVDSVGRAVGLVCVATIALMGPTTVPLLTRLAIPFGEEADAMPPFPHFPTPPLAKWAHSRMAPWVYGKATLDIIRDTSDGSVDSEPVVVIRTPSKNRGRGSRTSTSSTTSDEQGSTTTTTIGHPLSPSPPPLSPAFFRAASTSTSTSARAGAAHTHTPATTTAVAAAAAASTRGGEEVVGLAAFRASYTGGAEGGGVPVEGKHTSPTTTTKAQMTAAGVGGGGWDGEGGGKAVFYKEGGGSEESGGSALIS